MIKIIPFIYFDLVQNLDILSAKKWRCFLYGTLCSQKMSWQYQPGFICLPFSSYFDQAVVLGL